MFRFAQPGVSVWAVLAAILVVNLIEFGCDRAPETIRTYALGERVQAGPLVYTAFDTRWLLKLGPPASKRIPADRFLIVRVDVANGGATEVNIPSLALLDDAGRTINELTDGTSIPDWLGIAWKILPVEEQKGDVAFDACKLRVADETDQIVAYIDLPLTFGADK